MLDTSYSGIRSIILPNDLTVYMPDCFDDRKAKVERHGRRRVEFNRAYYLDPKEFGITYPFHMWRDYGQNRFVDYVVYVVPKGTKVYYDDRYRYVAVKPKDESRLIRKYVTFNIKESSRFSFCMMLKEKMGYGFEKWEKLADKIEITKEIVHYQPLEKRLIDIKTAMYIQKYMFEFNLACYFRLKPMLDGIYYIKQSGENIWSRIWITHTWMHKSFISDSDMEYAVIWKD